MNFNLIGVIFGMIFSLGSTFLFTGCSSTNITTSPSNNHELQKFSSLLIGEFSSKDQAEEDSSYFNIYLSMSRIWENDKEAIWLYVEQAMDERKDKPYRQRVYKLGNPQKNVFTSDIYTIRNQELFIGLQNDKTKKDSLIPSMIELKEGCTVTMKKMIGLYSGGTDTDKCPSNLRGASFATTKITLKENTLESWDQGFDKNGVQVWGATKGGYRFVRIKH